MSESGEEQPKPEPRGVGRRGFLKGAVRTVGGLAVAGALGTGVSLSNTALGVNNSAGDSIDPHANDENLKTTESSVVFKEMFPNLSKEEEVELKNKIKAYQTTSDEGGIGTLDEFSEIKQFLKGWGEHLEITAEKYGLNPALMKGIIFIESSGKLDSVNKESGAVGVCQLMPETARRYGMIVNEKRDDRKNPFHSIIVMAKYLRELRDSYDGNMGIATWAYHAGDGNGMTGVGRFLNNIRTKNEIEIGDYLEAANSGDTKRQDKIAEDIKRRLEARKNGGDEINVYRLLQNHAVLDFISQEELKNDTGNYAIKATAAAEYFEKNPLAEPNFVRAQ